MSEAIKVPTQKLDSYEWYYRGRDEGRTEALEQIIGTIIECLVKKHRPTETPRNEGRHTGMD